MTVPTTCNCIRNPCWLPARLPFVVFYALFYFRFASVCFDSLHFFISGYLPFLLAFRYFLMLRLRVLLFCFRLSPFFFFFSLKFTPSFLQSVCFSGVHSALCICFVGVALSNLLTVIEM